MVDSVRTPAAGVAAGAAAAGTSPALLLSARVCCPWVGDAAVVPASPTGVDAGAVACACAAGAAGAAGAEVGAGPAAFTRDGAEVLAATPKTYIVAGINVLDDFAAVCRTYMHVPRPSATGVCCDPEIHVVQLQETYTRITRMACMCRCTRQQAVLAIHPAAHASHGVTVCSVHDVPCILHTAVRGNGYSGTATCWKPCLRDCTRACHKNFSNRPLCGEVDLHSVISGQTTPSHEGVCRCEGE